MVKISSYFEIELFFKNGGCLDLNKGLLKNLNSVY